MNIPAMNVIGLLWGGWAAYWFVAARSAKQDRRQESPLSRASHLVPLGFAAWLLFAGVLPGHFLGERFLPDTPATSWVGVAVVAFGLGFAIWARYVLGRNWSSVVQVKEDHELIQSGPYRWVRHPIYTGMLLGFAGSAVALDEWRGIAAVLLVILAFQLKIRIEEEWMTETFGDGYRRYRAEVRALIPFVL